MAYNFTYYMYMNRRTFLKGFVGIGTLIAVPGIVKYLIPKTPKERFFEQMDRAFEFVTTTGRMKQYAGMDSIDRLMNDARAYAGIPPRDTPAGDEWNELKNRWKGEWRVHNNERRKRCV